MSTPSGVVTFLFTDIEGSTRRWESDAGAMRAALFAHDEVLRTAIEAMTATEAANFAHDQIDQARTQPEHNSTVTP